jgi:FeS assembly SUF system regulator
MVRLDKLTDYGLVLLACIARSSDVALRTARNLAAESGLPQPTVSRLLQDLLKGGLLVSHRGIRGGYALAKAPREISVASVITALEGPVTLTVCSSGVAGQCDLEPNCAIKSNQRVINNAVRAVLEQLTLADMMQPLQLMTIQGANGKSVPTIGIASGIVQGSIQ